MRSLFFIMLSLILVAGCVTDAGSKKEPNFNESSITPSQSNTTVPFLNNPNQTQTNLTNETPSTSPLNITTNGTSTIVVPPPNVTAPFPPADNVTNLTLTKHSTDKLSFWANGTQLRGANVYQRRVYVELDGTEFMGSGVIGPPLTQSDFDNLAKAGANLVVLSHPGIFDETPPYAFSKSVQDNLDKLIDMAEKADLFVVIAYRTGPGRSEFSILRDGAGVWFDESYLNDDIWKVNKAQDAYAAMWKSTAEHYRNRSVVIGYDLMVEPNSNAVLDIYDPTDFYPTYEDTTYDWNSLHPRITKAIRQTDNSTPILIGGLDYSSVSWLPYLKPNEDNRTVYTVHQYEPQDGYTHQNADELDNGYPGSFDISGDGTIEDFNKAWIDDFLGPVDTFKTRYGVPVAVTEYGVQRWEPGADLFIDDETTLFEKRGMNYVIWDWSTSYKPVTDSDNAFNFRFGSDPAQSKDTNSKLYDVIKKYWKKNTLRPSNSN